FDIAVSEPTLLERFIERRGGAGPRCRNCNLHPLEVGKAAVAAGLRMLLANEQRGIAVAGLHGCLVGNDFDENTATDRVVEARRNGSTTDLKLPDAERCDHLRRRIEPADRDVNAFCAEEAHGISEIVPDIADG